tara:strand:+ start:443 stop:703 length:261 start_codon:yes stop_codon:yes gene_type:complete
MVLSKKIISCIWDNCTKQVVEGYVYVKIDDIIKLNLEKKDLIMDNGEYAVNSMNNVATYLNNNGWIFESNPNTGDVWRKNTNKINK